MALNTFKCNFLTLLHFEGLRPMLEKKAQILLTIGPVTNTANIPALKVKGK